MIYANNMIQIKTKISLFIILCIVSSCNGRYIPYEPKSFSPSNDLEFECSGGCNTLIADEECNLFLEYGSTISLTRYPDSTSFYYRNSALDSKTDSALYKYYLEDSASKNYVISPEPYRGKLQPESTTISWDWFWMKASGDSLIVTVSPNYSAEPRSITIEAMGIYTRSDITITQAGKQ